MRKVLLIAALAVIATLAVVACGGDSEPKPGTAGKLEAPSRPGLPAPTAAPGAFGPRGSAGPAGQPAPLPPPDGRLDIQATSQASAEGQADDRKIISNASIALEVPNVDAAIDQVRAIAESFGGTVSNLSSSGERDSKRATVTVRVPTAEFFNALKRLESVGLVLSRDVGREDVTERFIDLQARLRSAERQEQSLLALMGRAQNVGDILTLERELNRVRTEIERYQGQINAISRRVDLATIAIALTLPRELVGTPPSGTLTMDVEDVAGAARSIESLVTQLQGTIDSVSLSEEDGKEKGFITFRVFRPDFDRAMAALEDLGEVRAKSLLRGSSLPAGADQRGTKPDSPIQVALGERDDERKAGAIAVVVVVAVAVVAAVGFAGYRWGRRRPKGA